MSEEKETTPPAAAAASSEEKPAEDPPVDLAKQNEQTVAQTNAINDAVTATQVRGSAGDPQKKRGDFSAS